MKMVLVTTAPIISARCHSLLQSENGPSCRQQTFSRPLLSSKNNTKAPHLPQKQIASNGTSLVLISPLELPSNLRLSRITNTTSPRYCRLRKCPSIDLYGSVSLGRRYPQVLSIILISLLVLKRPCSRLEQPFL